MASCNWVSVNASGISVKSSSMPHIVWSTTDTCRGSESARREKGHAMMPAVRTEMNGPCEKRPTLSQTVASINHTKGAKNCHFKQNMIAGVINIILNQSVTKDTSHKKNYVFHQIVSHLYNWRENSTRKINNLCILIWYAIGPLQCGWRE